MTNSDLLLYHGGKIVGWLNPAILLVGLGITAWAFIRCRKWGYLVLAIYFTLAVAEPHIMRAINAHRGPDLSAQTEEKIAEATQEAIHKVLAEEGLSYRPVRLNINFPLGQILIVTGLWLLARRETPRAVSDSEPTSKG